MRRALLKPASTLMVLVVAVGLLAITVIFGEIIKHRSEARDRQQDQQRMAICSVLSLVPPNAPPSVQHARIVFCKSPHR